MSPVLVVSPEDRCDEWMTLDLQEEEDVGAVVVFPLYGPNHHAGLDCWCMPEFIDGTIVHSIRH